MPPHFLPSKSQLESKNFRTKKKSHWRTFFHVRAPLGCRRDDYLGSLLRGQSCLLRRVSILAHSSPFLSLSIFSFFWISFLIFSRCPPSQVLSFFGWGGGTIPAFQPNVLIVQTPLTLCTESLGMLGRRADISGE